MSFIRTVTSRGRKYRQLVKSKWDPIKKRSVTEVIKHLGTVVEENGQEKLIKSSLKVDSIDKSYQVGKLAIYWKLIEEFGIRDAISKSLGPKNKDLIDACIILILNQLTGRKALTKIGSWIKQTPLPRWFKIDTEKLTKDYFLRALDAIVKIEEDVRISKTLDIQMNCVKKWKKIVNEPIDQQFLYLDATRIRYNGQESEWAEKGYGSQVGRPHIGFNLVTSKDNLMPVLGFPIRGSHTDSTTISETINALKISNSSNLIMVCDKGFLSLKNVTEIRKNNIHILSAGSLTSKGVRIARAKYTDSKIERRENILRLSKNRVIYYIDWIGELYGQKCRIVVSLDPERRNRERIQRDILMQELETTHGTKKIKEIVKQLNPVVKISRGRNGYKVDKIEEQNAKNSDGRCVFFCTDIKIPASDIIITYYEKDQIEKAFRFLKGDAELGPVRFRSKGRIEAYLAVICFIAYELIATVKWKIKENELKLSFGDLIDKAKQIHEVELTSKGKKIYRWTHMTKKVIKLFEPFDITSLRDIKARKIEISGKKE